MILAVLLSDSAHSPCHVTGCSLPPFSAQDADYEAAGARIGTTEEAFGGDLVLKIRPPSAEAEVPLFKDGSRLVSFIQPAQNRGLVDALADKRMSVLGKEA